MYTFSVMLILIIKVIETYFSTRFNLLSILNGFKLFQKVLFYILIVIIKISKQCFVFQLYDFVILIYFNMLLLK